MTAIFLKKICLWFLGQIKWAQNSQGSIQIVSGITRVFFRFLIRKYLHPKIDQSDSMNVISSLLHTKTNIELIPFYCKVNLILS